MSKQGRREFSYTSLHSWVQLETAASGQWDDKRIVEGNEQQQQNIFQWSMDNPIEQIARARKPENRKSDRSQVKITTTKKKKNLEQIWSDKLNICYIWICILLLRFSITIIIIIIMHSVLCSLELNLLFYCHNWPQSVFCCCC